MNRFIGIGGKFAAGKDVAADHLVKAHGWIKIGMSDLLNEALLKLDPIIPVPLAYAGFETTIYIPYTRLYAEVGYVEAKKNEEVRRLLQKLGTEVGRDMIDQDLWVNLTAGRVQKLRVENNVVVTGIRFPNELAMVEHLGGQSWWIDRPQEGSGDTTAHASETSVNEIDFTFTLYNDGTIEQLQEKVDTYLELPLAHTLDEH